MAALSRCVFLVCLLGLTSCAAQSVRLIHPESGATATCGAAGVGIMAATAEGIVEECLRNYGGQGYVPVEKLAPDQRADLERRGVLPKPEEPPIRMGY